MNDYADHIRQLARDNGVQVWLRLDTQSGWGFAAINADDEPIIVLGLSPHELHGYLIALHELGHLLHPEGRKGLRLDQETCAWLWAREHALDWDWELVLPHLQEYARDRRYKTTRAFATLLATAESCTSMRA